MERPENCSDEMYDRRTQSECKFFFYFSPHHYRYSIIRSCWADDSYARPSFKKLASQWENLLGNSAKYLELDCNGVSNPLYCASSVEKEKDCDDVALVDDGQLDETLDHLWRPPTSLEATAVIEYDIPRPLIESKTTEQILRYQNDLTIPLNNNGYKLPRISQQNIPVDLSHYDSPIKRRKSYVDMSGGTIYNLESQHSDKKNLSKDITFRFSSLLNINEQMTSLM